MTTEEMLALPDDGTDRWLIRGRLRERPHHFKDRFHASTMAKLGCLLCDWNDQRPYLASEALAGMVGCRLRRDPDSTVGIDLAWVSKEVPDDATGLVAGPPVLAVEILSPEELVGDVDERLDEYLACGVRLVWLIDTHDRTVTIYRPGRPPEMVNSAQELSGDPELPGFQVAVARLFP
jgi:Uma2 family endonuclease